MSLIILIILVLVAVVCYFGWIAMFALRPIKNKIVNNFIGYVLFLAFIALSVVISHYAKN